MISHLKPHAEFDRIVHRMESLVQRCDRLQRVVFRSTEPAYATGKDLLTGEGSRRFGGRWNGPQSFATVYAAFSDHTAIEEAKAHFVHYGFDPADALPRTLVAIDIKLQSILDLSDGAIRKSLGLTLKAMRDDPWREENVAGRESLTQALGRAVFKLALEGLVVPSCDGERNVVWFPQHLGSESVVKIRNLQKLR